MRPVTRLSSMVPALWFVPTRYQYTSQGFCFEEAKTVSIRACNMLMAAHSTLESSSIGSLKLEHAEPSPRLRADAKQNAQIERI